MAEKTKKIDELPEPVKKQFREDIDNKIKNNNRKKKKITKDNSNLSKIKEVFK